MPENTEAAIPSQNREITPIVEKPSKNPEEIREEIGQQLDNLKIKTLLSKYNLPANFTIEDVKKIAEKNVKISPESTSVKDSLEVALTDNQSQMFRLFCTFEPTPIGALQALLRISKTPFSRNHTAAFAGFYSYARPIPTPDQAFQILPEIAKLSEIQSLTFGVFCQCIRPNTTEAFQSFSEIAKTTLSQRQLPFFFFFCESAKPNYSEALQVLPEIVKITDEEIDKLSKLGILSLDSLRRKLSPDLQSLKWFLEKTDFFNAAIKSKCLQSVKEFNGAHALPSESRLGLIRDYPPKLIYEAVVFGNEEIFTSTFNILFDGNGCKGKEKSYALLPKLKQSGEDGYDFIHRIDPRGETFRTFLRTCAQYNKLNDFLATMPKEKQKSLMEEFIGDIEKSNQPTGDAVAISETLAYLSNGKEFKKLLPQLEIKLKAEYERLASSKNLQEKQLSKLLGLVISHHANLASGDSRLNSWLKEIQKKYPLPNLEAISSPEIFQGNINIQQHFFYNDSDGVASFEHFINYYKQDASWKIVDKRSYVFLEKKQGDKSIQIFANKPQNEDDGVTAIEKELASMKLKSIVVVHRGHSYHAQKTIARIPKIARIVSLGSCGGFNNIGMVLAKAPGAHIISTKSTGSMLVNDALFKLVNEHILSGKDLNWRNIWREAQSKFESKSSTQTNKYFKSYISPYENIATQIINSWNKINTATEK